MTGTDIICILQATATLGLLAAFALFLWERLVLFPRHKRRMQQLDEELLVMERDGFKAWLKMREVRPK